MTKRATGWRRVTNGCSTTAIVRRISGRQKIDPLNVYSLNVPAELAPGRYSVRVLVYDAESLAPLTWIDAAGNPAGIEPEVGTVEVGG
jgi:hypothetical protein